MKITVCDVCYYSNGQKLTNSKRSKYRISYKQGGKRHDLRERIALDVCEEHSDFFKTAKSFKEAKNKYYKLFNGKEL